MTSASGTGGTQPGSQPGTEDEIIRLLSDPAVFGPVDRIETHVSLVFLGPRQETLKAGLSLIGLETGVA